MMRNILLMIFMLALGFFLGGFTRPSPDLQQYRRLPLSIRLDRLHKAGIELFNRRRYEEAIVVFQSMFELDESNLGALFWIKKCKERLDREKNEAVKDELYRTKGSLRAKESLYDNWIWGPTVGHFEVRYAPAKPYVPPVKKKPPTTSDDDLKKLQAAAAGKDAPALFALAMGHWARKEKVPAIDALEAAVEADPRMLELDDFELLSTVLAETTAEFASGKESAAQRMLAGRVALIQGDVRAAVAHLIKAATQETALGGEVRKRLQSVIDNKRGDFLYKVPEISTFRQAYTFQDNEDRIYLQTIFSPATPLPMVPLDLYLDPLSIKSIDVVSSDTLFVLTDPAVADTTRLWVVCRDRPDPYPQYSTRLMFHIDGARLPSLDLSNYNVSPDLPDNWSAVIGLSNCFGPMFPAPQVEEDQNGIKLKGFQLRMLNGKGPAFLLSDFRQPLPEAVDVWKFLDTVGKSS